MKAACFPLVRCLLATLLRTQWAKTLSLEMETDQTIPTVFHWNGEGTIKPIHPKALYRRWKVACRLTGLPPRIPLIFGALRFVILNGQGCPFGGDEVDGSQDGSRLSALFDCL